VHTLGYDSLATLARSFPAPEQGKVQLQLPLFRSFCRCRTSCVTTNTLTPKTVLAELVFYLN